MASKNKTDLKTDIDNTIYENLSGAITPTTHNPLLTDINDSVVNELEPKVQADLNFQDNNAINISELDLTVGVASTYQEGRIFYDNDDKTLAYYNDSADMVVQVGQEAVIKVRNNSGITISNGEVVTVTGSLGNRPTIKKAIADTTDNARVLGVVTETTIENNSDGYITTFGNVRDFDTSAFVEGDIVYLSDTVAGGLTTTEPDILSGVGLITRSNNAQGSMLVSPRSNFHLHTNLPILEATTASFTTEDETKLDGIEPLAEVNPTSTTELTEGTNLYYTEVRVSNNSSVAANTAKETRHADTSTLPENTNLYYTETRVTNNSSVSANTAKVSADGNVTTHADVTSAGSGQIITAGERTQISTNNTDRVIISDDDTSAGQVEVAVLTQAQYDGLTPDTNTLYFIK